MMSVCRQQSQQASRTDNKNYDMCACQQIKLIYEKKTFYKKIVKYTENKLSTCSSSLLLQFITLEIMTCVKECYISCLAELALQHCSLGPSNLIGK